MLSTKKREKVRSYLKEHFPTVVLRETENGFKFTCESLNLAGLNHLALMDMSPLRCNEIDVKRSGTGLVVIIS